jgi:hypothetical protein
LRAAYLFPDFSGDEGRVNHEHVEGCMQVRGDILWLVEIIEDKTGVFVELLIELEGCVKYLNFLHQRP